MKTHDMTRGTVTQEVLADYKTFTTYLQAFRCSAVDGFGTEEMYGSSKGDGAAREEYTKDDRTPEDAMPSSSLYVGFKSRAEVAQKDEGRALEN